MELVKGDRAHELVRQPHRIEPKRLALRLSLRLAIQPRQPGACTLDDCGVHTDCIRVLNGSLERGGVVACFRRL